MAAWIETVTRQHQRHRGRCRRPRARRGLKRHEDAGRPHAGNIRRSPNRGGISRAGTSRPGGTCVLLPRSGRRKFCSLLAESHCLELGSMGKAGPAISELCLKAEALPGRCECYIPGDIQDQRDAARVFQPMIFQDTGARFPRRASQRNFRLADLEVYVFQGKVHRIDRA